jgi:hypothetical protein
MTDQIKGKSTWIYLVTSTVFSRFRPLHFYGILTLTSLQCYLVKGRFVEKFNVTIYAHILTHFLTDKIGCTKSLTEWQFAKKVVQGLTLYLVIFKLVLL